MNPDPSSSDLLFVNGRVFGGPGNAPPVWNESILVRNGKIVAVGAKVNGLPSARIVDLQGDLLLPGLCDAHMHMAAGGHSLGITDLSQLKTEQIGDALKAAASVPAKSANEWLEAFNWDESIVSRLDADLLEKWVPGRPLIVHKRDLHGCCCNRTALRIAGITEGTSNPDGGGIGQNADGRPSGMLFESAIDLVTAKRPPISLEIRREHILRAQDYLAGLGLTAVSEVLDSGGGEIYSELADKGELNIDVDGWLRFEQWDGHLRPYRRDRFTVGTIKLFLDGSFGSSTAAMIEPFSDGSGSGMLLYSDSELEDIVNRSVGKGWRLAIHAIGDLAVEQACRVLAMAPQATSGPHRIEHLQQLPQEGTKKVTESRAAASIQPVHLLDDQKWLPARIGPKRCRNSFIWRSLFEHGVILAFGSDWPVATPDPILNLHTAINRARFGEEPDERFDEREALLPWQAIRGGSYGYAAACGRTGERGSLMSGMQADITVVRGVGDSLSDWSEAEIRMTVSRGEIIFDKNNRK